MANSNRRLLEGCAPAKPSPGSEDMPEMKDPAIRRYYGYDRRNWEPEPPPPHLPDAEERAIADEKARLAKDLQQLQSDMQKQERSMASTEPGASSKMRKALSDAEQKELAMRMQKTAEWMRQGYGERNLGVEESMAAGMEQLSRDLQDVQKTLKNADPNGKNRKAIEMPKLYRRFAIYAKCSKAPKMPALSNRRNGKVTSSRLCLAMAKANNKGASSKAVSNKTVGRKASRAARIRLINTAPMADPAQQRWTAERA